MDVSMNATPMSGATASDAEAVRDGIVKSMMIPKKMLEANLRAGSALLSFASHRMQAQAQFLGGFVHCDTVEDAAAMQKAFIETMVGDYSREMNELMTIARENSILLAETAEAPKPGKTA